MSLNPYQRNEEVPNKRDEHRMRARHQHDYNPRTGIGTAFGLGLLLTLGAIATVLALGMCSSSRTRAYYSGNEPILSESHRQIETPYHLHETLYNVVE